MVRLTVTSPLFVSILSTLFWLLAENYSMWTTSPKKDKEILNSHLKIDLLDIRYMFTINNSKQTLQQNVNKKKWWTTGRIASLFYSWCNTHFAISTRFHVYLYLPKRHRWKWQCVLSEAFNVGWPRGYKTATGHSPCGWPLLKRLHGCFRGGRL